MKIMCPPDYDNSILNLVSSLARHYGVETGYRGLPCADAALASAPRTVVLMVFDGMGARALERNLPPDSFLRRAMVGSISTVFPSTTVAAMTSFYSGLSPLEHGWLGWSLYFKEYARTIDTFLDRDSFSKRPAGIHGMAGALMPYETIGARIEAKTGGRVAASTVNPRHVERNPDARHLGAGSLEEFLSGVEGLCRVPGEKYVLAYWDDPDSIMHDTGPYSPESAARFAEIDAGVARLAANVKDALLFVTADHGQVEIGNCVDLAAIPELDRCLAMAPFIESRAMSFFLVPGREKEFARAFRKRFGAEFLLLSRREFLRAGLLGRGTAHPKVEGFIGDYMAIGLGDTILVYRCRVPEKVVFDVFKGHHAGLREEETLVPLAVIVR